MKSSKKVKKLSKKGYIVDTNVPITANRSLNDKKRPKVSLKCIAACSEVLEDIIEKKVQLILDKDGEILEEYRTHLSEEIISLGGIFFMLIHNYLYNKKPSQPHIEINQISIKKVGRSYEELINHTRLKEIHTGPKKLN